MLATDYSAFAILIILQEPRRPIYVVWLWHDDNLKNL